MKNVLVILTVASFAFAHVHAEQLNQEAGSQAAVVEVSSGVIQPNSVFNVLTYAAPRSLVLSETGLREAGLKAGPVVHKSDEIRIFSSRDVMNAAPLARIWLNGRENGSYWFITGGEGDASAFVIPEGAAVVVWSRASTEAFNWSNVFN